LLRELIVLFAQGSVIKCPLSNPDENDVGCNSNNVPAHSNISAMDFGERLDVVIVVVVDET